MASVLRSLRLVLFVCLLPLAAMAEGSPPFPPFPGWMSNGLYRTINEKERTYFGQPLADVVAAMDKAAQARNGGHCTAQLSSGEAADMSKPGDWLRDQGKLTPAGLAPMSWEVPVVCPGLRAAISLSPVRLTVVQYPEDKPTAAGADVFAGSGRLVIGDFTVATTAAPKPDDRTRGGASPEAWADMPSLARPVAIQIRAYRPTDNLASYVDLDAARQALANVPAPPPRYSALEAEEQQGDEATIQATEESVISYLAGRYGPRNTVVIADTSWRGGLPEEASTVLPAIAPDILGSAVADYKEKNRRAKPLSPNITVPGSKVVLVSEKKLASFFGQGNTAQGWARFSQEFQDTQLLTFSRPGLSRDLSQAVIFQGYQGPRIATGTLLFLRREADTWRVMYQMRLWVEGTEPADTDRPIAVRKPRKTPAETATAEAAPTPAAPAAEAPAEAPTPAPAVAQQPPAAPAEEQGPKVGLARVRLRFINDTARFRFKRADFFVNGDAAGVTLKEAPASATEAVTVWEGTVPAGASVLRARIEYTGKGYFPFLYLDTYPFTRELVQNFTALKDETATITVVASELTGTLMEDALSLRAQQLFEGPSRTAGLGVAQAEGPRIGLAHVKLRFLNDTAQFRFKRAEFFVNGDPVGVPLKQAPEGGTESVSVWEGTIPAGASVLRARLEYTGKGYFPFLYLDTYPFARELVQSFSTEKDETTTLTVIASELTGALLEDALNIRMKERSAGPTKAPAPAPVAQTDGAAAVPADGSSPAPAAPSASTAPAPVEQPKVGVAHVKVRFVSKVERFQFKAAEFFVDGDLAGQRVKSLPEGASGEVDVWEGTIPAGASVLRARLGYTGKASFPFLYLETYPFERETTHALSLKRDSHTTITITATEAPDWSKPMEETLKVDVKEGI